MSYKYNELYLDDVMENMGAMFEYALVNCNVSIEQFTELFISSGLASHIENGNPTFLAGKSGIELFRYVAEKTNFDFISNSPYINEHPEKEFWTGWILARIQWETSISFEKIFEKLPCIEIMNSFIPLHEASEEKATDTLIKRMLNAIPLTN